MNIKASRNLIRLKEIRRLKIITSLKAQKNWLILKPLTDQPDYQDIMSWKEYIGSKEFAEKKAYLLDKKRFENPNVQGSGRVWKT